MPAPPVPKGGFPVNQPGGHHNWGRSRPSKFKQWKGMDPNDSRYNGPIEGDFIRDPNDSR